MMETIKRLYTQKYTYFHSRTPSAFLLRGCWEASLTETNPHPCVFTSLRSVLNGCPPDIQHPPEAFSPSKPHLPLRQVCFTHHFIEVRVFSDEIKMLHNYKRWVKCEKTKKNYRYTTQLKSLSALTERMFTSLFLTTYIQYRINTIEIISHQTRKPQDFLSWKFLFT